MQAALRREVPDGTQVPPRARVSAPVRWVRVLGPLCGLSGGDPSRCGRHGDDNGGGIIIIFVVSAHDIG